MNESASLVQIQKKRCLIIDDDQELVRMLSAFFERSGLDVRSAYSTVSALKELERWRFDVIILDYMLPGTDGVSFLDALRKGGDKTPVIMLTAKALEDDRILGLKTGADDFLAKPFSAKELLARMEAIWRRSSVFQNAASPELGKILPLGPFELDFSTRSLKTKDGRVEHLSSGEFAMLRAFALNPGVALSRDRLMALCDEKDRDAFDRAIDVRITRLRKLLTGLGGSSSLIQTVRALGYVYMPIVADK